MHYNRDMNIIKYSPKAAKQLTKLPNSEALKIRNACAGLADMPNVRNITALVRHKYGYRLRVGNYRVLFDFDGVVKIVLIEEVKKRDERTY